MKTVCSGPHIHHNGANAAFPWYRVPWHGTRSSCLNSTCLWHLVYPFPLESVAPQYTVAGCYGDIAVDCLVTSHYRET